MNDDYDPADNVYAKVIADSIYRGRRLTTMEVQCHRFVLAEFNTHRAFSRNSASSRAIPFHKQLARMDELGPAYPLSWPMKKAGMQGGEELSDSTIDSLRNLWTQGARLAVDLAKAADMAGLHKSVVNRLLEPFMWHKIIVSATEWENFFSQRCNRLAQPEIRAVAQEMELALKGSEPRRLKVDEWHLPYFEDEDYDALVQLENPNFRDPPKVSAARCARVSYLTHDGQRDIAVDLDLYQKLTEAQPPHWSPLEHVAIPDGLGTYEGRSNFQGWIQLRILVQDERDANPSVR